MAKAATKSLKFYTPTDPAPDLRDAAMERARAAVDKLKDVYVREWAPAALAELDRTLKLARSSPEHAEEHLEAAYRLAHDMKGQGTTFGYPLISEIGEALCHLTYGRETATKSEYRAMMAHVEAAGTVLANELDDPESDAARDAMRKLQSAVSGNLH